MKSDVEKLSEDALRDYATARALIEKSGHIVPSPSNGTLLHPAHKLLSSAFDRWLKCQKLMAADKQHVPSDDIFANYT